MSGEVRGAWRVAYQPSSCSTSSGASSSTVSSQSGGGGAGTGKMPLCATYSVSLICRPSSSVPSSRSSSYCTSAASWRTSSTCTPHLLPDPDPNPNLNLTLTLALALALALT